MRKTVKALFWTTTGVLCISLVLTVIGGSFNLDGYLRVGVAGWLLGCFGLFAWAVLYAYVWVRERRRRRRRN